MLVNTKKEKKWSWKEENRQKYIVVKEMIKEKRKRERKKEGKKDRKNEK